MRNETGGSFCKYAAIRIDKLVKDVEILRSLTNIINSQYNK